MAKRNHSGLFCSLAAATVGLAIFASVPVSEAASLNIGGGASNTGGNNTGSASASFSGDDGSTSTGTAAFGNSPGRTSSAAAFGSGSNRATAVTNFNNTSNSGQARIGANSGSNAETATATFGTSPDEAGFTSSLGTGPSTPPDIAAATPAGITGAIGQLSIGEQQKLVNKCTSVLAAPQRYDNDVVSLCKVIAAL
ncbi:MAG TPA: hypothetical protein VET25_09175 [Aestuariivirgaceae bacterium]|nr:hypothetical protein [Aestuariivirgaceae bacterium]